MDVGLCQKKPSPLVDKNPSNNKMFNFPELVLVYITRTLGAYGPLVLAPILFFKLKKKKNCYFLSFFLF